MAGVIALCAGFLADLGLGDPRWLYHPVCAIGKWIAFWEKKLRRWFPKTGAGERAAGIVLVLLVLLACGRHSYGGFAAFVPVEFLGRSGGGNLLVLSDAGDKVFEDREHEGL